jgi:hypothetical protein
MAASAKDYITNLLAFYGLGADLTDWAWGLFTGEGGAAPLTTDEIVGMLPQQQAFKDRFPAYEQLAKDGRGIDIPTYMAYEKSVRSMLQQYNIPAGMYDTPQGIASLLLNDVDVQEVNQRLAIAADAAFRAPQEVRDALAQRYGMTSADLTAYYLDPDRALPLIQQQYTAAQVAGAASRQGFNVDTLTAERLASQGVDYGAAASGFGKAASEMDLTNTLFGASDQSVTQGELVNAQFGDAAAANKTEKVARQRSAAFGGQQGGIATNQSGVSGLSAANR